MSTKTDVYVSAMDSTGAKPDYFSTAERPRKSDSDSDSISIEIMTYNIFKPEPHSAYLHPVAEIMQSPRIRRLDLPTNYFVAAQDTSSFLSSLELPSINSNESAKWCRNLQWSYCVPLGDMAARLLKVGRRIVRFQQRQPLRMAVVIAKNSVIPSLEFGHLISKPPQKDQFKVIMDLQYAMEAARKAAAINNGESLEIVRYDGSDSALTCAICLDDVQIGSSIALIPCSHKFHGHCLSRWKKNSCPMCRSTFKIDYYK